MLLGTVLWAVASLETGIGPIVAARPEVVISLRSKALMIGKKGRAERTRRESHGSAEGIIFSRNIPFIWSLLIYTRKRTRTSFSIHPYLRFPFIRFILPCIYPFIHPSIKIPSSPRHAPSPIIFIHVPPSLRMVHRRSLVFIVHRLRRTWVARVMLLRRRLLLLIEGMRHVLNRRRRRVDGD
jgi:hypothetical protein